MKKSLGLGMMLGFVACVHGTPRSNHVRTEYAPAASGRSRVEPEMQWGDRPIAMDSTVPHSLAAIAAAPEEPIPLSLTASDGTGLRLKSLKVNGVVQDPLAFTELHMVFENPEPRTLEGHFEIVLPPNASVSRFAMKLSNEWQEGEVIEKQRARQVYEDFLHRRQDPALLENAGANRFSARVFPIPANGVKEIIVSYSHELADESQGYKVFLRGLPRLEAFHARVHVNTWSTHEPAKVFDLQETNFTPPNDLRIELGRQERNVGVFHDGLAVLRVRPEFPSSEASIDKLTVLFDTSASRALGLKKQIDVLFGVVNALRERAPDLELQVVAFDQDVHEIFRGYASEFGAAQREALEARGALGASHFENALRHLARTSVHSRMLVISDGEITAGEDELPKLEALFQPLKEKGLRRVDALIVGGIHDRAVLAEFVNAAPNAGLVIDGNADAQVVAHKLSRDTRSDVRVEVSNASWVWPQKLEGVQAGDPVIVYAAGDWNKLRVSVTGATLSSSLELARIEKPLIERAVAKANIERLTNQVAHASSDVEKRKIVEDIVLLSTQQRVLSEYTAMLVLETEEDYQRYGIAQNALSNILTVGERGIEVLHRGTWIVHREAHAAHKALEHDDSRMVPRDAPQPLSPPVASPVGGASQGMGAGEAEGASGPEATSSREVAAEAPAMDAVAPARRAPNSSRGGARMPRLQVEESLEDSVASGAIARREESQPVPEADPWTGIFGEIMKMIERRQLDRAVARALEWHGEQPGDVLALVALGDALEAKHDVRSAARAYGSLIDLYPARADLRRMAGERLERLDRDALLLAVDTYKHAAIDRPDHPSSHRLYAYALLKVGRYEEAFAAIQKGLEQSYPEGRFRGVDRILREDLGLIGSVWMRVDASRTSQIKNQMRRSNGVVPSGPSLRFVLNWETDANDVDFHIFDGQGGHAFYSSPQLPSGGELYADVTTGYGPECFTIHGAKSYPYRLQAHYYSRGPMGYGMGKLEVIDYDGAGHVSFEEHPFVIMKDHAYIDLGTVRAPLHSAAVLAK